MDAGLGHTPPAASRSRAARRAAAQRAECAATAALNVLGQKWVMRIIRALGDRTQRFCELQDALGGANSATLSQRLKLLADEGRLERMATAMRSLAQPDAAAVVAEELIALATA